jgi:hypothetical protein
MAFVAVAIGGAALAGVASSAISSSSASKAAQSQTNAINAAQANLDNLDPNVVNEQALQADTARAKNQIALQAQIDPALAAQRQQSEGMLSAQLSQIGNAQSDQVANAATQSALAGVPGLQSGEASLVSAANQNLAAGATLPADLQAQMMQSGLEQTGAVTGTATARGAGGPILQQVLGTAGLQLQQQRQTQAANLMTAAGNLDSQRQQILQSLFPKLQTQQLNNMSATSGVLNNSNNLLPQAGLSGANVANIWLAKVGATNQLTIQAGNVNAQNALAQGAATNQGIGAVSGTLPGLASYFNSAGSSGGSGSSGLSDLFGTATTGGGSTASGLAVPSI